MKVSNADGPGERGLAVAKGHVTPRAGGRLVVEDTSGNEVQPAAILRFGSGFIVTDIDDETALVGSTGGAASFATWFNVKDYGAVGNGTTDDTSAINAAIAALIAAGGGVLYFPKGAYLCSTGLSAITVPAEITGDAGRGSPSGASFNTEIICSSATATLFDIQDHVTFRDIQLRNTAATPSAGAGIAVTTTGTDLNTYDNILVKGFYINIDIQQGGGWSMHNCFLVGPIKYALKVRNIAGPDGGDWAISNSWFYASDGRTADAGIRIESAGGGKITNCKINFLNASGALVRGIDVAPAASTSILLVHGNSFENTTGDSIHIETSTFNWDHISIVGNQFGHYTNTTGNAIEITCANVGEVEGVVISSNIFRQTGGGTPVAVALTKAHDVMLVGNVYEQGFAGGNISDSGSTSVVNLDLLGATPSGELGGTWDAITVDSVHSGSAHLALGSTSTTAAAGNHTHSSSVPPSILLESGAPTPFTFDDILQESDGSDFLWAST